MKVLDSSVLGEEWEGLNCVEDDVIFLGKSRQAFQAGGRAQTGSNRNVLECRIQAASLGQVVLDPRVSVM